MIHRLYGNKIQETGHRTEGHMCVTEEDRHLARHNKGSLLYGELLPRGVNRALDSRHLDSHNGESLFDLGMGTGKVVLQVFMQCPHLKYVYGVELSHARFRIAESAALKMVEAGNCGPFHGGDHQVHDTYNATTAADGAGLGHSSSLPRVRFHVEEHVRNRSLRVWDRAHVDPHTGKPRELHLEWNNLLEVEHLNAADFVLLETDIPMDSMLPLACLL
jgi:hypothetical protein